MKKIINLVGVENKFCDEGRRRSSTFAKGAESKTAPTAGQHLCDIEAAVSRVPCTVRTVRYTPLLDFLTSFVSTTMRVNDV